MAISCYKEFLSFYIFAKAKKLKVEYLKIGTIRKPHGVKGHVRVEADQRYRRSLLQADVIFVHLKGNYAPYFVESVSDENLVLLKLEEVDAKEAAKPLNGQGLYLRQQDVLAADPEALDPEADFSLLTGFMIEDQALGKLGVIEELIELPMQLLASIKIEGNEVLIPLHEDLILEVIPDQQLIRMDLPEGLIDLVE
jgi:16S rRNA processing protein RimM